ncbi:hypothetical protein [Streptomyces chiangmaiensis]|uniref:hypothetical protein n=1 Tax=Streptomyces chiangmaiensis TaxID=766497 RepID=UPI002E3654C2|nr:hypothetical protein [Streptomyces chiangmaiensis]
MTDTGSDTAHPGLIITVYRVNPETLKRTPVSSSVVPAANHVAMNLAFPPCECPRCRAKEASR